jgi:hypothetical protein
MSNWRKHFATLRKKERKTNEKNIVPPPWDMWAETGISPTQWNEMSRDERQDYLNTFVGKLVAFPPDETPMILLCAFVGNGNYTDLRLLKENKIVERNFKHSIDYFRQQPLLRLF